MAVRIGPLADSSLLVRRVGRVSRVLVASPDYLSRRGMPGKPADVASHDTIFGTATQKPLEWRFHGRGGATTVRLAPRMLVNEVEAQLVAARAGCGIARVLSYQVADDLSLGTLVRVLRAFEPTPLPVQLVAVSGARMLPKVRAFLDYAAARLAELRVIQREGNQSSAGPTRTKWRSRG